ncbi:MAG TPA: L,D-transpeptidase family protein [Thermoanaerobaculia bacterium]
MSRQQTLYSIGMMFLLGMLLGGCRAERTDISTDGSTTVVDTGGLPSTQPPTATATQTVPQQQPPDLRLEVNLAQRELYVYRSGERIDTHKVAVGSKEWPTPTGEWTISQVVWNPEWIPPNESWAEDEEPKQPGDPDNPLGRVQLVYQLPNSIHGTNAPDSVGKAVSHGSIRVTNEVGTKLGRQVMESGGASRDEAWFERARANRTEKQVVEIPNPVPISVVPGKSE